MDKLHSTLWGVISSGGKGVRQQQAVSYQPPTFSKNVIKSYIRYQILFLLSNGKGYGLITGAFPGRGRQKFPPKGQSPLPPGAFSGLAQGYQVLKKT